MLKNFLIVKTSAIGDIIQSFPIVEYLRKRFPGCIIDWVVEKRYVDLLTSHPHINKVFVIDSYDWRKKWFHLSTFKELFAFKRKIQSYTYDAVFDLQGNTKSALITLWSKSVVKIGFGWNSVPEKPNFLVTNHRFNIPQNVNIQQRYLSLVQSYFQDKIPFTPQGIALRLSPQEEDVLSTFDFSHSRNIMVAFGSKWENKQLRMDVLIQFLQKIGHACKPYFFFIYGNSKEKAQAETLANLFSQSSRTVGGLSFALWQALMSRMDSVIAMDSAALHLCGTTSTPSFSVFGSSAASVYKPLGAQHTHIQGSCPYDQKFVQRCPLLRTCKTGACMKNLQAEALFERFIDQVRTPCVR